MGSTKTFAKLLMYVLSTSKDKTAETPDVGIGQRAAVESYHLFAFLLPLSGVPKSESKFYRCVILRTFPNDRQK